MLKLRATYKERSRTHAIEGFGKNVTGGEGHTVATVTSPNASGAGTFNDLVNTGPTNGRNMNVIIQFAEGVDSFKVGGNRNLFQNVTIDGFANNHPNGVTHDEATVNAYYSLNFRPTTSGLGGNVIIKGINFRGSRALGSSVTQSDLIWITNQDTTSVSWGGIGGFVIDRCTFNQAPDGSIDITGSVSDITIQWCLITESGLALLSKYGSRQRVSVHHNIFAACGERPEIKGNALVDWVNNIDLRNGTNPNFPADYYYAIFDGAATDPYGLQIWNGGTGSDSVGNVTINVRGCAFLGDKSAFRMREETGSSAANVYWEPFGVGSSFAAFGKNYSNPRTAIRYMPPGASTFQNWTDPLVSPSSAPNSVAGFEVTQYAVNEMASRMVPYVGCPGRVDDDQTHINNVLAALALI